MDNPIPDFFALFASDTPSDAPDNTTPSNHLFDLFQPKETTAKKEDVFDPYDWENPDNCSDREYEDDEDYDDEDDD